MLRSVAVQSFDGPSSGRVAAEQELDRAGISIPLMVRNSAAERDLGSENVLFVALAEHGVPVGAIGVVGRAARGLPKLRVWRASRFVPPSDTAVLRALLSAIRDAVAKRPWVLRVELQCFGRDVDQWVTSGHADVIGSGFQLTSIANDYTQTLVVNLEQPLDTLFASLDRSTRRNIRELAKHAVELAPIDDYSLCRRLDELHRETVARTGGTASPVDWALPIALSADSPDRSRFVGIFLGDKSGPERLVGYAWGQRHGSFAEYSQAGSTRQLGFRLAIAYPLVWDLISWAHRQGAQWFDLGGVTLGTHADPDDPLGGISDFKRSFSSALVNVSREYRLPAQSLRARLAEAVHRSVSR